MGMSLLEFVKSEQEQRRVCILERARAALTKDNREHLDHMMDNCGEGEEFNISQIARALNAVGSVSLSRASVDAHVKGDCVCTR